MSPPSSYNGTVTETRLAVGYTISRPNSKFGYSTTFGNLPVTFGQYNDPKMGCFIYGQITYVAGVAGCTNCRISSSFTMPKRGSDMKMQNGSPRALTISMNMSLNSSSDPTAHLGLPWYPYCPRWNFRRTHNLQCQRHERTLCGGESSCGYGST